MPIEDFERMLTLNLRPTYLVTQAALPHLRAAGGGSIVCVSARPALKPFSGASGYVTAEGRRALARRRARRRVPRRGHPHERDPAERDRHARGTARACRMQTRRSGSRPDEIAAVIGFLVSDASAPTSGAHVPVYGRA